MDYSNVRSNMVESQLRPNQVTNESLLDAFGGVPREKFVAPSARQFAYLDENMKLGSDRHLMEPRVLGRLLQTAEVKADDMVLVVACNSGYSAALLGELASTVVALESDAELAAQANSVLQDLGADNVVVVEGALDAGYAKQGPYSLILIDGAVDEVPEALSGQLADGGRLLAIVRDSQGVGRATLMQRDGEVVSSRYLFDAAVPVLSEFAVKKGFEF
ncbi:protein-L-isoaspartate O-methyltransferase family protein [Rhodovibrionaceae bacterium A322]